LKLKYTSADEKESDRETDIKTGRQRDRQKNRQRDRYFLKSPLHIYRVRMRMRCTCEQQVIVNEDMQLFLFKDVETPRDNQGHGNAFKKFYVKPIAW